MKKLLSLMLLLALAIQASAFTYKEGRSTLGLGVGAQKKPPVKEAFWLWIKKGVISL